MKVFRVQFSDLVMACVAAGSKVVEAVGIS